jgi:hypothetical protein
MKKIRELSLDKKEEKEAQLHFTCVSRVNKCTVFNHVQQIKGLEIKKKKE